MNRATKKALLLTAFPALAACLFACDGNSTPGENLDRALDKTGETVKDAGDAIKPK